MVNIGRPTRAYSSLTSRQQYVTFWGIVAGFQAFRYFSRKLRIAIELTTSTTTPKNGVKRGSFQTLFHTPSPDLYGIWSPGRTTIRPQLRAGTPIRLTHEGHNAVYLGEGWGPITAAGTNSYATEAVMYFERGELAGSYEFVVEALATEQDVKGDLVDVYANGHLIGSWDFPVLRRTYKNRATIDEDVLARNDMLEIRFKIKSPGSWVVERGKVRHIRVRGIRVKSVQFNPTQS